MTFIVGCKEIYIRVLAAVLVTLNTSLAGVVFWHGPRFRDSRACLPLSALSTLVSIATQVSPTSRRLLTSSSSLVKFLAAHEIPRGLGCPRW